MVFRLPVVAPEEIPRLLVGSPEEVARAQATLLDYIYKRLDELAAVLLCEPEKSGVLVYPNTGGLRATPAGVTYIDLRKGQAARPDATTERLSGSLNDLKLPRMRSAVLFFDTDVDIEVLLGGKTSGKFCVDQCAYFPLYSFPMDAVRVISNTYPYNMKLRFSTLPSPPVVPRPTASFQERYGSGTTTDSFTAVPLGPTWGGVLTSTYLVDSIYTAYIGVKMFTLTNTGDYNLNFNLQLLSIDGKTWVDDPVTGSSTTLASGNSALIETGIPAKFFRLRVRSATAGQATTFELQYWGSTVER